VGVGEQGVQLGSKERSHPIHVLLLFIEHGTMCRVALTNIKHVEVNLGMNHKNSSYLLCWIWWLPSLSDSLIAERKTRLFDVAGGVHESDFMFSALSALVDMIL
jgi:hypothetical protein